MSLHTDDTEAGGPKRLSATALAYRAISDAILTGEYAEGQFLDEAGLARTVGTSRTPIREALHRLHAERYVDLVPRRGAQVRVTTATEMQELYETRLVMETAAMTKICRLRRGAPPTSGAILSAMTDADDDERWFEFARLDQRFHHAIVEHCANAVLTDLYEAMRPRHIRLAVRTITEAPGRRATIEREHHELVAALDAHDDATAVRVLEQHLTSVPELMQAFPR